MRRFSAAKRRFEKLLAAIAAQIEAASLIGIVLWQFTIGVEFFEALEDFANIFKVIAVVVDGRANFAGRWVHFHSYHVGDIVRRVEFTLAEVATVLNHLAINPFLNRTDRSTNREVRTFIVVRIERAEQAQT
jgi:hypothetical protein